MKWKNRLEIFSCKIDDTRQWYSSEINAKVPIIGSCVTPRETKIETSQGFARPSGTQNDRRRRILDFLVLILYFPLHVCTYLAEVRTEVVMFSTKSLIVIRDCSGFSSTSSGITFDTSACISLSFLLQLSLNHSSSDWGLPNYSLFNLYIHLFGDNESINKRIIIISR